ncbi:Maf family nucleotide pyrophosphatase [Candidatus Woesearchaeota archaeon]|nr:Maf family nucleotide pyrophosphatase [Candidatus Woesearchaeota archaeon]MBW3005504.1 Maf family nucleotide pyrophosphatase [Candidatus Woesearchaeota archaeon]
MDIILASNSSFRKNALDILGLKYKVISSNFDEKSIRNENPEELAKELAEAKAKVVGEKNKNAIIIAADLFVVFNNKVYEKPETKNEAFEMLKSFSGNNIDIIAGLAVYNSSTEKMLSSADKYTVKFRELKDYEINDYIERDPVLKLSGAFGPNGLVRFAETIEGHYPFVTALPMSKLILFLRENGLRV